jgi:carotenoid cleavage dioxygenase
MGYAAKGEGSPDVAYYLFDKNGKKLEECWFQAPYVGVMHDIAATDKWVIFTLNPLVNVPEDLLKAGHKVYGWDEAKSLCLGILPRRNPKPEMVKWFEYKNAFLGHTSNAFDGEDGCVYFDAPVTNYNLVRLNCPSVFLLKFRVRRHRWQRLPRLSSWHGIDNIPRQFWFFPPVGQDMASAQSSKPPKDGALSHLMRFKLDPNSTEKTLKPRVLVDVDGELPRIDARYETKPYKYVFIAMHDPETDDAPVGGAFNSLAKANVEDGTYEYWSAGKDVALGEVAFVARSKDGKLTLLEIAFPARSNPFLGFIVKADLRINFSPRG